MSKQKGKGSHGDRRKHQHQRGHDSKHRGDDRGGTKFDEERFLRDMASVLGGVTSES